MNEATDTTASCLALAEKRPQRPGGCAGIFFQLFDWNRRLAKKKLFSRKLLAPATAKQTTRKFGGDEKMPKTKPHPIADENSENFQDVQKNGSSSVVREHKHEMRTAGLVARLMGLESMPAVHRDKHKKASNSAPCDVKEDKIDNTQFGFDGEVLNLEKNNSKVESRRKKLQKTGQFERQAITRFGAEALQIRNVLSRSRKHQHPKLTSPLKSPRISSSRNGSRASRLINAATRILEPGLQATNRAKCALTYPGSGQYASKNEVLIGGMGLEVMSHDLVNRQQNNVNCDVNVGGSLMGQTSCRNCGNLLDVVDSRLTMEDQPFPCPSSAAYGASTSTQRTERMKPRPLISSPEQVRDEIYHKRSTAAERLDHPRSCSEPVLDRKPVFPEGQIPGHFRSQHCRFPDDEPSSIALPRRNGPQHVMSVGRNEIPSRAKLNNLHSKRAPSAASVVGLKEFVTKNRSLSSHNRAWMSTKADSHTANMEREVCVRHEDSLPQLRTAAHKGRTVTGGAHIERTGLVSSTSVRQKNVKCDLTSEKTLEPSSRTANHASIKTGLASQGDSNRATSNKNHDVKSLTTSSPLKKKNFVSSGLKESMNHFSNSSHVRKLPLEERGIKTSLQRKFPLGGDSLGALLGQKLKELTSQEEDESTDRGSAPKRSTAMILQELISALIEEQPFSSDHHALGAQASFQTQQGAGETSVGCSHGGDHLSPGSVLETSFSNDSCLSSSVDDNSGCRRLLWDPVDYLCDRHLQPAETNSDIVDSATSVNEGWTGINMVTHLLNHISKILQSINLVNVGLIGSRLTYVKEVIVNADLLLADAAARNSDRMKSSFVGSFLLDELESLAGAMQKNISCLLGFEESKDITQIRRFIFDSVIECLDSKYGRCCNSGYKAWRRIPLCMNAEMLIEEVGEEIRRWTNMVGMNSDEIIEWEMSHSLGKWTDFEIEVFETGTDIGWDILQVLVDDILKDFCNCRTNSF